MYPNKLAYADENRQMTFREVWDEAQRIASYLNAKGVFRAPVLVYMNKTAECLTAFMGVLLSGNFYCPLDVDGSIDNANKIMKTMKPICIITENDNFEKSAEFAINVDRVTYGNATKTEINEKKLANRLFCSRFPSKILCPRKQINMFSLRLIEFLH